ncbi:hypothetical protein GOP47_0025894 [Adiantum capillus-veneris]|uniref:Uncharacterized protein n=1 Tax=Adiantum capillus-veneris TaxID=13818 RepID=A0A9D4Z3A2_ADICA|nr:hypothetical protein GOP47_0025894 [Adiantum capillus-veneris]
MDTSIDYLFTVFRPFIRGLGIETVVCMIDDIHEVEWLLRWWAMGFDLEVHDWDYLRFFIALFEYFCENDPIAFMGMFPVLDEDIMVDPIENLEFITLDDEDEGVPLGLPIISAPFGFANAPTLFHHM